jgi:preprotein translocase subunit SecF
MSKFSRLGNDLYTGRKSIDFIGRTRLWYSISGVIMVLALGGLFFKGLDMGIEFVGGAEYKVSDLSAGKANQDTVDAVREAVAGSGIDAARSPVVTTSGTSSILVQTEPLTTEQARQISSIILETTGAQADSLSQTEIGASWGKEVAQRSLIGLIVFLVLVVLFIWAYFRQWKMSVAGIVALAHDVIITVGVYALSGFEVTPATVTGVLTILGFSLYDTVVVFDKVRENTRNLRETRQTYSAAANLAVNQTLVRSINTSVVALIPVGAILYVGAVQLGSGSLKDLALALFVGMAAGAYSSIFIATPLLVHMKASESEVKAAEKRAKQREKQAADRYASVPSFNEGMAVEHDPNTGAPQASPAAPVDTLGDPVGRPVSDQPGGRQASSQQEALGRGRTAPPARGPVGESRAAGRTQPERRPRSKRGKK